jgi:integrase/recombinase XerC
MPILFTQYQQTYLDHLRYQKRYSENTITSYAFDLTSFKDYLYLNYEINEVEAVKSLYIRSWLADLKESGMSSRSINRKITSIRSFYNYLLKKELVKQNPVASIISPKTPKRLPQFVEKNDLSNLFAHVEFSEGLLGKMEELILQILYNTGIRKAELISLNEFDIDRTNQQIKVLGKGNKERLIPISIHLLDSINNFIVDKRKELAPQSNSFLFVNKLGLKLDPKTVYNIVKKYLSKVTTIDKKSPHILRHSFATHLMNEGADLNAVKELLGHSSLAATQIYTHNTIEKLKDVYKKAHPKA